jgi:endonuclease YncB( thermonuclease family)
MVEKNMLTNSTDVQQLVVILQKELETGRQKALQAVEEQTKITYWTIGKHIKEHLLEHDDRAEYGAQLIQHLSEQLGITNTLLYQSVKFYEEYPKILDARPKLSWTHIRTLLTLPDTETRKQFEKKVITENLSVRELKDAIRSASFKSSESAKKLSLTREEPYVYRYKIVHGKEMVDLGFRMFLEKPNREVTSGEVTHYTYKAYIIEIIDGDTLWVDIDLGFNTWTQQKVRLRGVNTPKLESEKGLAAQKFVLSELKNLPFVALRTYWRDKFTRYLVDVFYGQPNHNFLTVAREGAFLNQALLDNSLGDYYEN